MDTRISWVYCFATSTVFMFVAYSLSNLALQLAFYYIGNPANAQHWKLQPRLGLTRLGHWQLWLPGLTEKGGRGPYACIMFGFTMAAIYEGQSNVYFETPSSFMQFVLTLPQSIILPILWQCTIEYYWHRALHSSHFLYKNLHKYHHFYTSPEPFDDMYMHPLEGFMYYLILYSPPFIFRMHIMGFVVYLILMGATGIMDHSGVRFHIPFIYNSKDHDDHHRYINCNYGFPFPWFDILHGTFRGTSEK